jgi:HTH-type transcriptional regulator/antitoxin HigA
MTQVLLRALAAAVAPGTGWSVLPGEVLREALESNGLTQAEFAAQIGRPAQMVSEVITGKKSITPETALDFELVLGISADFWVRVQADYDLSRARARAAGGGL